MQTPNFVAHTNPTVPPGPSRAHQTSSLPRLSLVRLIISFALFVTCAAAFGQDILTPRWIAAGWSAPNQAPQYSHDGSTILVTNHFVQYSGATQAFGVYKVSNGQELVNVIFDGANGNLTGACISNDGLTVYYGLSTGKIYAYDVATQIPSLLNVNEAAGNGPRQLVVSHDGKTLAYIVSDLVTSADRVGLYNLTTNAITKEFDYTNSNSSNRTTSMNFISGDSGVVLDGPTTYDFTGKMLHSVSNPSTYPVTVSQTEAELYTLDGNYQLHAYKSADLTSQWAVNNPLPFPIYYETGQISSDGKVLLYSTYDKTNWYVYGINTTNGTELAGHITATPPASSTTPYVTTAPNLNQMLIGPENEPSAQIFNLNSTTGSGTRVGTFFAGIANNYGRYVEFTTFSTVVGGASTQAISIDEYHQGEYYQNLNQQTLINCNTGATLGTLPEGAVVSPKGDFYITISGKGIDVYNIAGVLEASYGEPNYLNVGFAVWINESTIVVADNSYESNNVYFLNFGGQSLTNLYTIQYDGLYRVSPDGSKFATFAGNSNLGIYVPSTGKSIGTIAADTNSFGIDDFNFSSNNHIGVHEVIQVSGSQGLNEYRVFDVSGSAPKLLQKITYASSSINSQYRSNGNSDGWLSPDGQTVILGNTAPSTSTDARLEATTRLYQVSSGKSLKEWNNQMIPDYRTGSTFYFSGDSATVFWTTTGQIVATATTTPELTVSFSPATVVGGNSSTGTISLVPAPTANTTVNLTSTASALTIPASVTIPAGSTSVTFNASTNGVDSVTTAQVLALENGASAITNLTISPATASTLTFNPSTVAGDTSSTGTVTLTGLAGPSGVTVSLTSKNTTVVTVPSTVKIPSNAGSATFTATTTNPSASTAVTVTAGSVSGTLTVTPNSAPVILSFSSTMVKGGNAALLTATLPIASSLSQTFTLAASNSSLTPPTSITIPAGQLSVTIGIPSNPVLTNTSSQLTASLNGAAASSASITVQAPLVVSVIPSITTAAGATTAYALIVLDGPAPSGFTVAGSSNNTAVTLPSSIPITAGQSFGSATLTISAVTAQTAVTITIGGKSFTLTLFPY